MDNTFPSWITKQMIKGIKAENRDAYLMALEGWRRGLALTWYYDPAEVTDMKISGDNPYGKMFSLYLDKNNQMQYFYRSRGNKVSNESVHIVANKHMMKQHLTHAEVPVSKGVMFEKNTKDEAILELIKELQYPLVVKPTVGSLDYLGEDTVTNITDAEFLLHAIQKVRESYEYDDIIVEEHVPGDEYRVYVTGNKVVAAVKRKPANVIGNGDNTIEELISKKNKQRTANPYFKKHPIQINQDMLDYLRENDQYMESIPNQGEAVQLSKQNHINAGGEHVDATDNLSEDIKQIAINAVKAIPGLHHAGVDVINHNGQIYILEIHATADIGLHIFPADGKSQNVPAAIIDYYFPETKGLTNNRNRIYFDFVEIDNILKKKFAQELTITNAPDGELHTARYIISGKVQKVGYRIWIRKQAIKKGLHGYTRNLENGNVVVVIGGHDKHVVDDFKEVCLQGSPRSKVKKVKELDWELPIKIGFELRKSK